MEKTNGYFAALICALVGLALLFGCASAAEQQKVNEEGKPQIIPAEKTMPAQIENDNGSDIAPLFPEQPPAGAQAQPSAADKWNGSCSVEFQRGAGEMYYIFVKGAGTNAGAGEITVSCPDGEMARIAGNAFFCEKLSIPNPTVAYVNGIACGSARFSGAGAASAQPAATNAKMTCVVGANPKKIVAGDTLTVSIHTSIGEAKSVLSYDCGGETRSVNASGIYSETKICRYNEPGVREINASIDGVPCGSANVTIYKTRTDCSVQQGVMQRETVRDGNVYSGYVYAHGFSGSDELHYECFGNSHSVRVGNIPSSADFEYKIECSSQSKLTEPVRVAVGGIECGSLLPP